jgi:hypothetical protein
MKYLILYFVLFITILGCNTVKNDSIIYGKVSEPYLKLSGSVTSCKISYNIENQQWPDTMYNQYVKITGRLKTEEHKISNKRQMFSANHMIKDPVIELITNDSIIALIDSCNGDCFAMTSFIKQIQKNKMLDSIVLSKSIIFVYNDENINILSGYDFYKNGSKNIFFKHESAIPFIENKDYFIISHFNCTNGFENNFQIIYKNIEEIGNEVLYNVYIAKDKIIIKKAN